MFWKKMLTDQYNHEFNERPREETEISREDHKFLEMEKSAALQNGKYCLKLPFKKKEVFFPQTILQWPSKGYRV